MKILKNTFAKQVAEALEEKIKNEEYKIGSKIPTEPDLVEYFGVSRNTIREAVQSLIQAGLLEARQGKGTYVIAKDRLQINFFSLLDEVSIENIMEVRVLFEKYIVESAILNSTTEDINYIEECLKERNTRLEVIKENTDTDLKFHIAIAYATHNQLLIHIYKYVSSYFNQFISKSLEENKDKQDLINSLHTKLFLAIKNKNLAEAQNTILSIINL